MNVHESGSGVALTTGLVISRDEPLPSGALRAGSGSPLVLLHGVTGSARMWQQVMPLLAPHYDVVATTALGHRGGPALEAATGPTQIRDIVDDAERSLDRLGFGRVHLAGNSMGGWVALELARRGRALSVCALSPAGVWQAGGQHRASHKLRSARNSSRAARWLLPLLAHSARFRRWALRDNAANGERVPREELLEMIDDMLGCAVAEDLLRTNEALAPLEPSCPVTLAWCGEDRLFPVHLHRAQAEALVPHARFTILRGVGHVPMLDDAELVARTILESCREAARS